MRRAERATRANSTTSASPPATTFSACPGDAYGGSFDGRTRLLLYTVSAVRDVMPDGMPLLVRISGTDWQEGSWDLEQTTQLGRRLKDARVDLVDVSSGDNAPASIPVGPRKGRSCPSPPSDPGTVPRRGAHGR